jgi:hypothetical protein
LVTSASLEQLSAICADKLGGACDGTEAFAHNGSRNLASFASDYQLQCDSGARLVGRNASAGNFDARETSLDRSTSGIVRGLRQFVG